MRESEGELGSSADKTGRPKANILMVDDNPANLFVLRAILEGLDQILVEAHSGEEAIRLLQQTEFAVILLDVQMPGTNGFETAKLIRSQQPSRHAPLIFLTAYDSDEFSIEEAYSLGAVDYLVKPFLPAVLKSKVAEFVALYQDKVDARREADQLRMLIQGTTEYAIFLLDPQGRVASWNSGAQRIKQYHAEEIIGQHFSRFYRQEAIDRGWPDFELRTAEAEGRFEDEGWRVRKDGTQFWANVVITALRDETGTLRGFSKITRDLTDKKLAAENAQRLFQAEAERRAAEERGARLAITQSLSQAQSVEEASTGILQAVCQNLNWIVGCFWFLPPDGEALECVNCWRKPIEQVAPFEAVSRGRTFRRGEGLPGRVWASGQPVWIRDVLQDTNFPRIAAAEQAGLHSALSCPIVVGGKTWGVVEFFSNEFREPDADLLEFVDTVAGQIGQFIERKQAEGELRDSERRFSRFMQHLPGLAWIKDLAGRYVYANDAAVAAFRVGREELYGRNDEEIFPPETAAQFKEHDRQALTSGTGAQVIETLKDEHGVLRHSIVSKFPILGTDGSAAFVGGMAIDMTDQIHAAEALRQHKERLELAQLVGRIGTFEWNIQTDEVEWSATEEDIFGLPAGSFGGRFDNWKQAVHPDDVDRAVADCMRAVADRAELATEFRIVRPDGQIRWIAAHGRVFCDELGKPLRMVGVNIDMTDRKDVEAALRDADRRKDEFLATLAHELRNPLAPIRNSLQILKMARVDASTIQQTREMMERQVHHLVRLVDDLLDVSRVMRGKIELRREPTELASVVARGVEIAQPLIDMQRHVLDISLPPESLVLDADVVRLAQVIGNLLTNSAKYTEEGGNISLVARREDNEAVVCVRDNGIGIATDVLPHIFELFMQVDHASNRSQGGLGIGLTLVKNLVELHGGSVQAHSAGLGQGSEFVICLPLVQSERSDSTESTPDYTMRVNASSGERLLVVDDNVDAATTLAMLLRLQGQEVQVAHDGVSALDLARSFRPALIFLDIGMPGMDGYEVARRIRQMRELEHTVLAAVTGWSQQEDRRRTAEAGFDHHLVKPLDPKALESLLADLKRGARERPTP